jgi:hypothetical protein
MDEEEAHERRREDIRHRLLLATEASPNSLGWSLASCASKKRDASNSRSECDDNPNEPCLIRRHDIAKIA